MDKQTARKHRGKALRGAVVNGACGRWPQDENGATSLPLLRDGTQETPKILTYKNNTIHPLILPTVARHKTSAKAAISREIEIPLQAKRGGQRDVPETPACAVRAPSLCITPLITTLSWHYPI